MSAEAKGTGQPDRPAVQGREGSPRKTRARRLRAP